MMTGISTTGEKKMSHGSRRGVLFAMAELLANARANATEARGATERLSR